MSHSAIAALRAFAGSAESAPERCDFCGAPLEDAHAHVLDAALGAARCACATCAGRAGPQRGAALRQLHGRAQRADAHAIDAAQWSALGIPVGLAWFYRNADGAIHARYPGAAGPVAPRCDAREWQALAQGIGLLAALEPEVEALLVRRAAGGADAWRVSIDRCWRLAGLLRRYWRGGDGGPGLQARLQAFFAELDGERA